MTNARSLACPRDGAALETKKYEAKIEIDECPTCKGVWLDHGELEAIQATVERDYSGAVAARDTMPSSLDAPHGPIVCLACGAPMDARPYGFGSQIVIDVCTEGCGVWLDGGELSALERFYEDSQRETEIPLSWRLWAGVVGVFRRSKPPARR
jgi:Zn-finger nucleic acid-binding protein